MPALAPAHRSLSLPASLAGLVPACGICVLLLGVLGDAAAQSAAIDSPEPAGAVWLTAPDVTAVRSHLVAPATAPPNLEGRPGTELAGVSYRWWLSRGRADLGFGVGTVGYVVPPADGRVAGGVQSLVGSVPTVTVGVRLRLSNEAAVYADASGAHHLVGDGSTDYVNAKVGMEWKAAKPRFGFERGALGIHFDSGYRMSLRANHGGIGVFLRGQF